MSNDNTFNNMIKINVLKKKKKQIMHDRGEKNC